MKTPMSQDQTLKPVSKTAYYCGGVRMQDAQSPRPLVNDTYALGLMGEDGLKYWEAFKGQVNPNASNISRCYLIDGWVREQLTAHPDTTVILIGAGLDTRAYRMKSGKYIEIDEGGIMAYKESRLAANTCPNPLTRISIDFQTESLADKLAPYKNESHVLIIVEGVLMYLTQAERDALLKTVTSVFPQHTFLCDLMNKSFFDQFGSKGVYEELRKHGAFFKEMEEKPEERLLRAGYQLIDRKSNVLTAGEKGMLTIPRFFQWLAKKTLHGYSTYQFRYDATQQ